MTIYKQQPEKYSNWKTYNPDRGYGQMGRFTCETLICSNSDCERYNQEVSEKEAFYHFAQLGLFSRMKMIKLQSGEKSLYVCPFCKSRDTLSPGNGNYRTL